MAIAKILKFVKQDSGSVVLQNVQTNFVIASFNPAQSVVRENEDPYRFKIVSSSSSDDDGFLLDYRTINTGLCMPQIVGATFDDFLIELSKKFFFLARGGHTPYVEGELLIFKRNGNQRRLELEINDLVFGVVEGIFIKAIYLGGDTSSLSSYDVLSRDTF
ncbi:hypothetical protein [Flavobacterium sp. ZB4P13]|uniref:hypothetical protein n=1 Tax=Flavobacterium sp. ZB4P13 TaxID=3401728 RepID=UPI003AAFA348